MKEKEKERGKGREGRKDDGFSDRCCGGGGGEGEERVVLRMVRGRGGVGGGKILLRIFLQVCREM